jgi:hypothetical protein
MTDHVLKYVASTIVSKSGNLGQSETKGCPVSRLSASESPRRISGGMGSAPKGVEDLEPGQANHNGHEWIRPASEPLFTRTRTWASCHVDGFRCSLVAHRDVAGASRLALFISARLYGPISPRLRKSIHPIKTMNDFA